MAAAVQEFLAPFFQQPAEDAEVLPDGSRVLFTLSYPVTASAAPEPGVSFVLTKQGTKKYVVRRNVPAGAYLASEYPVACLALLSDTWNRQHISLLPPDPKSPHSLITEDPGLAELPNSIEWYLIYLMLTAPDGITKTLSLANTLPQPGRFSAARHLLGLVGSKQPLPAGPKAWIAHLIRKTNGALKIADLLLVYGAVCRNAMNLKTPLTELPYALVVYPGMSHVGHSCDPSALVTFTDLGMMRLTAARDLIAGEDVTIHRMLEPAVPFIRTMQTAPPWVRTAADATCGVRCSCPPCTATLAWLRGCAGVSGKAALNDAAIKAIVSVVDGLWKHEETLAIALEDIRADPTVEPIKDLFRREHVRRKLQEALGNPMFLWRLPDAFEMLSHVTKDRLMRLFTSDVSLREQDQGPSLGSLAVAQTLVLSAIDMPEDFARTFPESLDLLLHAGAHWSLGGRLKLASLFAAQGPPDKTEKNSEVLDRMMRQHDARAQWQGFAAVASYAVVDHLLKSEQSSLPDVARVVEADPRIRDAFAHAVARITLWTGSSDRVRALIDAESRVFSSVAAATVVCQAPAGQYSGPKE